MHVVTLDVDRHVGFNMGNDLAVFVTYAAHLVDGNLITNLLSIGGKSNLTGPDPPLPASVAGLNTHAVFEGDASTTRGESSPCRLNSNKPLLRFTLFHR